MHARKSTKKTEVRSKDISMYCHKKLTLLGAGRLKVQFILPQKTHALRSRNTSLHCHERLILLGVSTLIKEGRIIVVTLIKRSEMLFLLPQKIYAARSKKAAINLYFTISKIVDLKLRPGGDVL